MSRFRMFALGLIVSAGCSAGGPAPERGATPVGGGSTPAPNPVPWDPTKRYHPNAIRRVITSELHGIQTAFAETNDGRKIELLPGLASLGNAREVFPSPDETKTAVLVERGTGEQDLYVSSLKNPDDRTRITTLDLRFISDVIWCEDKNPPAILFTAQQNGVWKLFSAPCDGSGATTLASGILPGVEKEADGSIWFRSGTDILVIRPGTSTPVLAPGITQSTIVPRFAMSPDATQVIYSYKELYLGGVRISTDTGTSGEVDASKVVFGPNGRYLVYFRVHTATGELAAYLVDLSDPGAEPVLISIPAAGYPPRDVEFSPDGSRVIFRQGQNTLLGHEIGNVTGYLLDLGPNGRIGRFGISDDGQLLFMSGRPDGVPRDKLLFLRPDGSWSQWMDLGDDDKQCRLATFSLGGDETKTYASRVVETIQGAGVKSRIETYEFDLSGATPRFQIFAGYDLPDDMGVWSLKFDRGRFLPGDDPQRALDLEFNIGDLRFASDGIDSGSIRPDYIGLRAKYKTLSNNRVTPVQAETNKLILNYRITARYFGNPDFAKIWNAEVFPDGRIQMWEWALDYNRFAAPQYSEGRGSLLDNQIILDEEGFPGRTVFDFPKGEVYDSVDEMLDYALDGWMPAPRIEYTSDRVTRDRTWLLELGRVTMD